VRLTLSYRAVTLTGKLSIWRAAACSEGRSPSETGDISSTTVENSSSRGYWRCRLASNTSSVQAAGIARSNASRA